MKNFAPYSALVAVRAGLICHGTFLVAVGLMFHSIYFGVQDGVGSFNGYYLWASNIILLLQFPVIHSLLLSPWGSKLITGGIFGGVLQTTTFVSIASLQLLAVFLFWSPSGIIWWEPHGHWREFFTICYVASWLLLGKSMWDAGLSVQSGSLGWTSLLRGEKPKYPGFSRKGLFRFVRQPIYLSFAMILWTAPTWTPDHLLLAVLWTTYCIWGPRLKEARFTKYFGEPFSEYQRNTPYMIPKMRSRVWG